MYSSSPADPTRTHDAGAVDPGSPSPGEPDAYDLYARGLGFLRSGHPHQAATLLGRAKTLEPEKASIREALGRALLLSGHAPRARREFAKAVALAPTDDYAHFALALACERTGQRDRARGHAKLAQVMNPDVAEYGRALRRLAS